MFDLFRDSIYTDTQLNDTQYRFFIRAKIAKNITSAYLSNDERVGIQETIQVLFDSKAIVVDNQDMTMDIFVDYSFSSDDLQLLEQLNLIPSPQGVGYRFIYSFAAGGTFGFSENPNAVGFGEGRFASLII